MNLRFVRLGWVPKFVHFDEPLSVHIEWRPMGVTLRPGPGLIEGVPGNSSGYRQNSHRQSIAEGTRVRL